MILHPTATLVNDKPDTKAKRGPATELAVAHMSTLKPEHQELLGTLMADEGMAVDTLEALVEHLFDEEDPRLTLALRRARAGVATDVVVGAVRRSGATVGDLRSPNHLAAGDGAGRGSVGSLRKR